MIDFIILLISFEVIDGNEIVYRDYVDISVAVASPKVTDESEKREREKYRNFVQGLVVPVLRNVEKMSFADIERTINEFGEKVTETLSSNIPRKSFSFSQAKKSSLSIEDMDGGTFTIRYELFFFRFFKFNKTFSQ